jgi:hypothetical protein
MAADVGVVWAWGRGWRFLDGAAAKREASTCATVLGGEEVEVVAAKMAAATARSAMALTKALFLKFFSDGSLEPEPKIMRFSPHGGQQPDESLGWWIPQLDRESRMNQDDWSIYNTRDRVEQTYFVK